MKIYFLLTFFLVFSDGLFAQTLPADKSSERINKIVIEESGIYAISKNVFDKISVDTRTNTVLHCYPDSLMSFWYKIYVAVDSRITFEIYPSNPDNRYNYFLYQRKGDLNIPDIDTLNIIPVRANLYMEKMNKGTGLSLSSNVSANDSCPRNIGEIFYRTPYHSPIVAKAGDVLLMNVYHLRGTDCGHHFRLVSNNHRQEFHAIYESCYNEQLVEKRAGRILKPNSLFEDYKATGIFTVKDSIRNSNISAEVKCIKQFENTNSTSHSEIKDSYELILEKNTTYQITFSAFGYQNKTVAFSTTDSLGSFTQNILLPLLKEGDGFVMDKIYFYPNTYAMRSGSFSQIDQLAAYLNTNPGIKIEIQGHTSGNKKIKKSYTNTGDSVLVTEGRFRGSARKLSQYRADLIKNILTKKGVSEERLIPLGYGGNKMIYPNPKDQEEANRNIRVGVIILSLQENIFPVSTMAK